MLRSALDHYRRQQRLAAAGVAAARRAWSRGPASMTGMLMVLMRQAAQDGAGGVAAMLDEQDITAPPDVTVRAVGFAETASDGRGLSSLLEQAQTVDALQLMALTQIADASRTAAGVAIAARPRVGWTRMVNPPCCARCAILAGRFYRWNEGFLRHPACDCRHIPTAEDVAGDVRTDPAELFRQGKVNGVTKAEQKAIEQGADINRVINARRSRYVDEAGHRLTREGTARARLGVGGVRPTPEQIYRTAGDDRDKALSLLSRFGYVR